MGYRIMISSATLKDQEDTSEINPNQGSEIVWLYITC